MRRASSRCAPSRRDGCIPRLIDDETWAQIQRRTALEISQEADRRSRSWSNLRKALQRSPLLATRDLRAQGFPSKRTIRTRLGAWAGCLEQAGQEPTELNKALVERRSCAGRAAASSGLALSPEACREDGQLVGFDGTLERPGLSGLEDASSAPVADGRRGRSGVAHSRRADQPETWTSICSCGWRTGPDRRTSSSSRRQMSSYGFRSGSSSRCRSS